MPIGVAADASDVGALNAEGVMSVGAAVSVGTLGTGASVVDVVFAAIPAPVTSNKEGITGPSACAQAFTLANASAIVIVHLKHLSIYCPNYPSFTAHACLAQQTVRLQYLADTVL